MTLKFTVLAGKLSNALIQTANSKEIIQKSKILSVKSLEGFLPKEIVGFIKQMPKGNRLKPLDKDTVYIIPHKPTRVWESPTVSIETLNMPYDLEEGLTLEEFKKSIFNFRNFAKKNNAIKAYVKNPTKENHDKVTRLYHNQNAVGVIENYLKMLLERKNRK